jgi:hypothetical protein
MVRFVPTHVLWASLGFVFASGAVAGSASCEPTYPPHIIAVPAEARTFYLEFRARNEVRGFGHSYVTLGTIDGTGEVHETVVVGFMPKSADDDHWSKFGAPVTGWVGVARSDFTRQPAARFRISISKAGYFRVLNKIRSLRSTWTRYEILVRNCNNFLSEIASSVALRTPLITARYPVHYLAELRALNSR